MEKDDVQASIELIQSKAAEEIQDLADRYRRQILVPLCRKYRLQYMAGNGRTLFFGAYRGQEVSFGDGYEARQAIPSFPPVFEVLDLPVFGTNDVFGFYIQDIR